MCIINGTHHRSGTWTTAGISFSSGLWWFYVNQIFWKQCFFLLADTPPTPKKSLSLIKLSWNTQLLTQIRTQIHSYCLQFMPLTASNRISAVFSEHFYTEKVPVQNKIETSIIVVVVWLNLCNEINSALKTKIHFRWILHSNPSAQYLRNCQYEVQNEHDEKKGRISLRRFFR